MDQSLHNFFFPCLCQSYRVISHPLIVLPPRVLVCDRDYSQVNTKSSNGPEKDSTKPTSQVSKPTLGDTYNSGNSDKMHCIRHGTCNNSLLSFPTWHPISLHQSSCLHVAQHRRKIRQQPIGDRPARPPLLHVQHLQRPPR